MALETFDTDDTLDDGEIYGQFTNQEGNSGNGYVSGGKYNSYHSGATGTHAYLITTNKIGSTFSVQAEFITSATGFINHFCGIYLGASIPTGTFDPYYGSASTRLVTVWLRRTDSTYRLEVIRTNSAGSKQYWNFSTDSWQSQETSWDGLLPSNNYRIKITRDANNTIIEIYDIDEDVLIETITAVNSQTKSIDNNAYFYFGAPVYGGAFTATGSWDNAGLIEIEEEDFGEEMIQQTDA